MNKVILIGNLGKDPIITRTTEGLLVANFSLATTERYRDSQGEKQEKTEWHRIVTWNKLAEIVEEFLKKGSKVCVEGKLSTRSWEDNGRKVYVTEIIASSIEMLGSSTKNAGSPPPASSDNSDSEYVPF